MVEPMDTLDGDTLFTITTQSEWIIWNSNGASGANGDSFVTMAIVAPLSPFAPLSPLLLLKMYNYQHYNFLTGSIVANDYESPSSTMEFMVQLSIVAIGAIVTNKSPLAPLSPFVPLA